MEKEKTCTFTGNRPHKLPWKDNEDCEACKMVKERIAEEIEIAIDDGYDTFISGMALGGDTYFAEAVLQKKKKHNISLVCAIPCVEQTKGWKDADKQRYERILASADEIVYTSQSYTRFCMHVRNRYMVQNSSRILVLDTDNDGGTKSTKALAEKKKLQIIEIL